VLADGASERWDLVFAAKKSIVIVARDAEGAPIPHAYVIVGRKGGTYHYHCDDESGVITLWPSDPDEEHVIELVCEANVRARREGVRAGDRIELVASAETAEVRGRFLDTARRARPGERVIVKLWCSEPRVVTPITDVGADGAYVLADVAPGRYRAVFASEQREIARGEWFEVVHGDVLDLGLIESRATGSLVVEISTDTGERGASSAFLDDPAGNRRQLVQDGDAWRTTDLEPGRHVLRVVGLGVAPHEQEVVIESGRETRVKVVLTVQRSG
jgi:hypothetical protein